MPSHDRKQLEDIATKDMPVIARAMRAAQKALAASSQESPFAEQAPDGWGLMYGNTRKAWRDAQAGLQELLGTAASRVDRSERGLLQIRSNYAATEELNVQHLQRVSERLGG